MRRMLIDEKMALCTMKKTMTTGNSNQNALGHNCIACKLLKGYFHKLLTKLVFYYGFSY